MNPSDFLDRLSGWIGSRVNVTVIGGKIIAGRVLDVDVDLCLSSLPHGDEMRIPFHRIEKVWLLIVGDEL